MTLWKTPEGRDWGCTTYTTAHGLELVWFNHFVIITTMHLGEKLKTSLAANGTFEAMEAEVRKWHQKTNAKKTNSAWVTKNYLMQEKHWTKILCLNSFSFLVQLIHYQIIFTWIKSIKYAWGQLVIWYVFIFWVPIQSSYYTSCMMLYGLELSCFRISGYWSYNELLVAGDVFTRVDFIHTIAHPLSKGYVRQCL